MSKKYRAGWFVAASFLLAPSAFAQERFGKSGTFAVSAERLFGFTHASAKTEDPDSEGSETDSWTTLTLLGSRASGSWSYGIARIAGDYFVIDGLSLGASLGYFTSSNSTETEQGDVTVEEDGPTLHGFLFAPRVGYAFMFQEKVGLWPRGGITFVSVGVSNETLETSGTATALTLEAPLVITPVPHVAFTVGPTLDIGLGGSIETELDSPIQADNETDLKLTEIAVSAGMIAYF